MKVLITGGTGFIGSNFVRKFVELDHEVHITTREESNIWRIKDVLQKASFHETDLTDSRSTSELIKSIRPDTILHFATYGAYRGRERDVEKTIDTNVRGTVNLLNACAETGFNCFINTGSSSEYGEKDTPMKETDILEPNNLYGVTKATATMYAQSLAREQGLPIVTMRLFSPYGYFEGNHRLMPTLIHAALREGRFEAPSPTIIRDFVFIEDVIEAYLMAIEKIKNIKGGILNIASGEEHSIAECVRIVEHISGVEIQARYGNIPPRQHEPTKWVADISKAKLLLDWIPTHTLSQGLSLLIQWTKLHEYA